MRRAWNNRPAERAADAVKHSCPPMFIHPVIQEANGRILNGAKAATQWYCPPAVGYMDAISAIDAPMARVPRKAIMLDAMFQLQATIQWHSGLTSCKIGKEDLR